MGIGCNLYKRSKNQTKLWDLGGGRNEPVNTLKQHKTKLQPFVVCNICNSST